MKELVISSREAGLRLDRYLERYLCNAQKNFIYKMLRKKNITLNDTKCNGNEKLAGGDRIKIFFSDETLEKFTEGRYKASDNTIDYKSIYKPLDIVYENNDIVLINKPSGMLSQKSEPKDISLVEYLTAYLLHSGSINYEDLNIFHPGICNRLDRNTSGIVAAGKTMNGLQKLSAHFKDRTLSKYYICIVKGEITKRQLVKGYLKKDHSSNRVTIYKQLPDDILSDKNMPANDKNTDKSEYMPIETEYVPVVSNGRITLLKIHLITGRSHQIRAHLASLSHPLAGDYKYGDASFNQYFADKYFCRNQMLHSYEIDIPDMNIHVHTDIPASFINVLKGEQIWQPGIPEVLEALH